MVTYYIKGEYMLFGILQIFAVVLAIYVIIGWDIRTVKYKVVFIFVSGNKRTRYITDKKDLQRVINSYGNFVDSAVIVKRVIWG